MPLNSIPPTTTPEGLRAKMRRARRAAAASTSAFWGGVVPGNAGLRSRRCDEGGVVGFKCFLVDSGVAGVPHVSEAELRAAMHELARLDAPLLVHAETPGPIERRASCCEGDAAADPRKYATFLRSRPRAAEDEAVALMLRLCRETGARVHIVHHSSSDALALLREAKADALPLTAETCPHYLTFAAEDVPDGATEFKCAPPIRERENRERLWEALARRRRSTWSSPTTRRARPR